MGIKPIMIVGAALALAVAPADSYAAREWFWGGGRFLPGPSQREVDLPRPIHSREQIRQSTRPTTEHTPLPSRRIEGRENVSAWVQQRRQTSAATTMLGAEKQQLMLERSELQRQRADLRKRQAEIERGEAVLARRQSALQQESAKGGPQTATSGASITCDAARAVVADFGFQEVEPELCKGKTLRFAAIRDGTKFSIEVAANGELTKVRRIP